MAVLTGQAKIDAQAKVTALANGLVSKSNDVINTAEVFVDKATPTQSLTGTRFGGPSATEQAFTDSSNKSALITQKVAIDRQIIANNEFITLFSDETKSWVNDPAIASARQQVQSSTLQLQTTYAKIDQTLATIDGAGPQIAATAAPEITTTDTAQVQIKNTTSPVTVAAGTSALSSNQLSKLKNVAGPNPGTPPDVSSKVEPDRENNKSSLGNQGILSGTPWTGPTANPDSVDLNKILPNVLHQYASYTYGLSLHLLTADEFNKIVDKGEYTPTKVLIASAGRYNNTPGPTQFTRSPYFKEDFYFDNELITEYRDIFGDYYRIFATKNKNEIILTRQYLGSNFFIATLTKILT